jgi:hypothetical protein
MKFSCFLTFIVFLQCTHLICQTNIVFTNPITEQLVKGNFNPAVYSSSSPINQHDEVIAYLQNNVSPDSLKSYILSLASFENRNTASDTVSTNIGIGAARRWAFQKFVSFSAQAENRLIPSYFQFDRNICSVMQHRNVIAVLPGTDTSLHEVIVIEGHMDSRCENECDITCQAQGIEDNASGAALVLELARVMSKCSYKNTLVFMLTIGEEQGLYGADAFADYCNLNDIPVKAVFNNDVIGGIICGQTSSAPSCPGLNNIDSTQVRIFSYGGFNSPYKQLARFIKLQYKEELLPFVNIPMMITIMSSEDRAGRGGDHIPFRQNGFASCRFTSANEHGDASNGPGYTDRQHTTEDILGIDTNTDGTIDSFFVDFNYLARNACINATGASIAALGPKKPDFNIATILGPGIIIHITQEANYSFYRVGVRSTTNDWDSVYTISGYYDTIFPPVSNVYYVSVSSVDENGLESLFSKEIILQNSQISVADVAAEPENTLELLQNRPNPFDEATIIGVLVNKPLSYKKAEIRVFDVNGKKVETLDIALKLGVNEVSYEHGYGKTGTYFYTLIIDGKEISRKSMIFAN